MTDFSRNQIKSVQYRTNQVDRWVVPNDRQLALRAKLGSGWSVRSNKSRTYSFHHTEPYTLSHEELAHINAVVSQAAAAEQRERLRIGTLVKHYQRIQGRCRGDGTLRCYLCNSTFHRFRSNCRVCSDCSSSICIDCYVETVNTSNEKIILCKICSEKRELWKKSGAWFFGELPPYADVPEQTPCIYATNRPLTPPVSPIQRRKASSRKSSTATTISESVSTGLGKEVQINIIQCKRDSDDSDDDSSSSSSVISYESSIFKFGKSADPDCISLGSQYLRNHPLLHSRRSDDSTASTVTMEEREFSGTESLQDLQKVSLLPTLDLVLPPKPSKKQALEVSFKTDNSSDMEGSLSFSMQEGIKRCQSVPDAELKDVNIEVEQDTTSPFGTIIYSIFYREQEETLEVELYAAQNLPDGGTACNAYASVNLVPSVGNSRKQRTQTRPNSLAPQWKEKLVYFGVSLDDLHNKSLIFSVIDERLIGSDVVIGEHRMPLQTIKSHELTHYHVLLDKKATLESDEASGRDNRGKIQLTLRYDRSSSQLYVGVVRCVALGAVRRDGYADPYVKLYLLPDNSKAGKKKTATKRRTLNPEFHEEFVYKLPFSLLTKRILEVSVWDHKTARNSCLGGLRISMQSQNPLEKKHWFDVIAQPDRRHDAWHQLKDIFHK
ncbi:rabphilin-3A-like [Watersipora subatra]|uniref:rabphilin-3A-like n=1 Tax=Watersipora subatra TaxID=2589382 RepID=UPI00355C6974